VITGKHRGAVAGVDRHLSRLGFDAIYDAALAQLVLARIMSRRPKVDSLRILGELGIEHASLRTVFRTLKRAGAGKDRNQVAAACFAHAATAGDMSLCLYDVTTLYSRRRRNTSCARSATPMSAALTPGRRRLLVDRHGFPLEIGCFEGNKADATTIPPIIQSFQARDGLADFVVVAVAGMLSRTTCRPLRGAAAVHRWLPRDPWRDGDDELAVGEGVPVPAEVSGGAIRGLGDRPSQDLLRAGSDARCSWPTMRTVICCSGRRVRMVFLMLSPVASWR
jgi:hypothetical protein